MLLLSETIEKPKEEFTQLTPRVARFSAMKKGVFLLLCFVAFSGHAQAPTATRPDSAIQVNVLQQGRYSSAFYTVNHEPLTAATVKALLNRYPPAAEELRKGRAQTRLGLGLLPVFVAALFVGGHQADQQRSVPGSAFSKAPAPFSVCLGAFFGSLYLGASNTHFTKAIEAYNRHFH